MLKEDYPGKCVSMKISIMLISLVIILYICIALYVPIFLIQ